MTKILFSMILLSGFLLQCMSTTSYKEAHVVEPGSLRYGLAVATSPKLNTKLTDTTNVVQTQDVQFDYYAPEVFARIGIDEDFDFGLKGFPIGIIGDLKWNLIGGSSGFLGVAFDVGIGYTSIQDGSKDSAGNMKELTIVDFIPSVIFTLKPAPFLSVSMEPKFAYRYFEDFGGAVNESFLSGVSFSAKLGNETGIIPMVNYMSGRDELGRYGNFVNVALAFFTTYK